MQKNRWVLGIGLGAIAALSAGTITLKHQGDLFRQIRPLQGGDPFERDIREITGDMFGRRAGSEGNRSETPAKLITALNDQKSQQPAAVDPSDWFDTKSREYTKTVQDLVKKATENDHGLLLVGTLFPAAGRLIRQPLNGGSSLSCSGIMISARHFLTAAHCFCEKPERTIFQRTHKDCIDAGAPKSARSFVFLPAAGMFATSDDPVILSAYDRVPDRQPVPPGQALGDIAIIELTADAPVKPAPVATNSAKRITSVGFGRMSLSHQSYAKLGLAEGVYESGIGTVAFPKMLPVCTARYTDTICTHYTDLDPNAIDTAACIGDSGGPLLALDADNQISVIGVTSERLTAPGVQSCDPNHEAQSVYTRVANHAAWIASTIGSQLAEPRVNPDCHEKLMTSLNGEVNSFSIGNTSSGLVVASITSAGLSTNNGDSFEPAPRITVSGGKDGSCKPVPGIANVQSCRLARGEAIAVDMEGGGLVQATSCKFP